MKKEKILGLAERMKKEGDDEAYSFLKGLASDDESDSSKEGLSEKEMDLMEAKLKNALEKKKDE